MTLHWPFWLILILPMVAVFWLLGVPRRALTPLRLLTFVLLLLAICGLSVHLPSRSGCVVLVADRSASMPPESAGRQIEAADFLYRSMGANDELAVVSFGERSAVEQSPQRTRFNAFVSDIGKEASNMAEALDRALSLIPADQPGRILVLSDGQATGQDVAAVTARAASAGVAIDYRPLQRSTAADVAIEKIEAPGSVMPGEAFMISSWISSPEPQEIEYELRNGSQIIARGMQNVTEGRNRLLFRDRAADSGTRSYTLSIHSKSAAQQDPVQENNIGRFLVGTRGSKPLLCIGPATSGLADLLTAGGLKVERRQPEQFQWTLGELAGYSSVLIENTGAGKIGTLGMETLSAWVTDAGGGLLTTGGQNAYGSGGYFKSVLEPILPVSMELRREHRKLSLAIVVALDRSGSMAATVPGGRTKMDLADVATAEVLNQLSGSDMFGCLAVDSVSHEIVPLSDLTYKNEMTKKILAIQSMGGGIFVYEALEKAAAMIAPASAGTRHIILFSDAADSEEPGDYAKLLEQCLKAGITVSVIGLGTEHDVDAALLKDVARLGGGQCMFTEDAHELPRLFAQDTFLVSRSTFIDEPTAVRTTAGMSALTQQPWGEMPQIGGYNLCYLRLGAQLAAVTTDEYQAPLVASWQAGTGRVLCYTGEADGKQTGPIGKWNHAGEFFTSLAKWVNTQDQGLGSDLLLTQELKDGTCRFDLHLDSERSSTPFNTLPQLKVLIGRDDQKPELKTLNLNWTSADMLSAELPLLGGQTILASLDMPGIGKTMLPPLCLSYSPEFAPRLEETGLQTLDRMARATGGVERLNLDGIWKDLPRRPRLMSLAPWLLIAALVLLLVDVLQYRTGLVLQRMLTWPRPVRAARQHAAEPAPASTSTTSARPHRSQTIVSKPAAAPTPTAEKTPPPAPAAPPPQSPAPGSSGNVTDALSQARNRASRRTQR